MHFKTEYNIIRYIYINIISANNFLKNLYNINLSYN